MTRPVVAVTASEWATWGGWAAAILTAAVGPLIQRRAQERRDKADEERQRLAGKSDYVGRLIEGYEGRIKDLREQIASDKAECQAEIAEVRAQAEREIAESERRCQERIAEVKRETSVEIDSLKRQLAWWQEQAWGRRPRRPDDTPPPEGGGGRR